MKISKCCGAPIMDYAVPMCSDCKDHCDVDIIEEAEAEEVMAALKNREEISLFDMQIGSLMAIIDRSIGGPPEDVTVENIDRLKKFLDQCNRVDEQMKKYACLKLIREGAVSREIAENIFKF